MTNPVAPVVTDEMVEIALHKWFDSEGEEIADLEADRTMWELYQRDMRAAITAALEASGELERLREALSKAEIEREYWRGFAVQTKQQVEGFVKKLQDWTNEGELIQGGYNAGT